MLYTYDAGGNRKSKIDVAGGRSTIYHYDVDGEEMVDCDGDGDIDFNDTTAADCYNTRNNRLMYEETFVPNPVGVGTLRRNKIYYTYATNDVAVGSPITIVRREYVDGRPEYDPFTPPQMYAMTLDYGHNGELRFLSQFTWTEGECFNIQRLRIDEFVSSGRAMRLTRQRDARQGLAFLPVDGTTTWRDYDGDEIYGDLRIDDPGSSPIGATNTASYVLGTGQVDTLTGAASYHHANQIGTLRAATYHPPTGPANVTGRVVYTAFGEQVHADGTIGTRYQYAGAWAYEGGLYEFVIPEFGPNGETPFTGVTPDILPAPYVHVGHRWYDPETGRFLQRDPIGIFGGLSLYGYAGLSPVGFTDPSGEGPIDWILTGDWSPTPGQRTAAEDAFSESVNDRTLGTGDAIVDNVSLGFINSVGGTTFNAGNRASAGNTASRIINLAEGACGAGITKKLARKFVKKKAKPVLWEVIKRNQK